MAKIDKEIENAKNGKPAGIQMKLNSRGREVTNRKGIYVETADYEYLSNAT
ncbi:MAG: hypothetical protein WDO06_01455 [Actinomycetota bacterium]